MVALEIICVGNELLIGKILNTNAHWLGKQATNIGANVKRITVVQDIVSEIASVICEALARKPEFIIMTGGLGPTFDDKTLQGVAKVLNRKLAVNQEAFEMVKEKMDELNTPEEILIDILHMILSHHGPVSYGWGSPVDPKTSEAVALHYADNMDAKVKEIFQR